jgi:hypothetical protein
MDTKRQKIVDAIVTKYKTISVGNGYLTDVGGSVFEWRDAPFHERECPAINFRDLDEPIELSALRSKRVKRSLHCLSQVVTVGDTPMKDVRKIIADMEKAISELIEDETFSALISDIRPRLNRAVLDQESLKFAGSTFEFYIDYPTQAFNSFA